MWISCYRLHYQFVMTTIEWHRVLLYVHILYENHILLLLVVVSFASLRSSLSLFSSLAVMAYRFGALISLWIGASEQTHTHTHMLRMSVRFIYELVSCLVPVEWCHYMTILKWDIMSTRRTISPVIMYFTGWWSTALHSTRLCVMHPFPVSGSIDDDALKW